MSGVPFIPIRLDGTTGTYIGPPDVNKRPPKTSAVGSVVLATTAAATGGLSLVAKIAAWTMVATATVAGGTYVASQPMMPWYEVCKHPDSTTRAVRNAVNATDGFKSCALVGGAGFLRNQRVGAEIDSHEFVMRVNLSPVSGYEEIAGKKTSMRVMNKETIGTYFRERACKPSFDARKHCPNYPIFLNSGKQSHNKMFRKKCPNTTVIDRHILGDYNAWDPVLHALWPGIGLALMSGQWGLAISSRLCPNGVTLYGFSHEGTIGLSFNATYHYYDDHKMDTVHDLSRTAVLMSNLAANQGECMTLHSADVPLALSPSPGKNLPLVDVITDNIVHDRSPEVYYDLPKEC